MHYQIFLVCMKAIFLLTMLFLVQQVFIVLGFSNYETYLDLVTPILFVFMWFVTVRAVSAITPHSPLGCVVKQLNAVGLF